MLADLIAAFALLTRLPVGGGRAPTADAVWAYPVVGAVVGGIGAAAYALLWRLHLPPVLAAIGALAVMLLATGALHEDGLADTADGFGGGRDREQKLAIMRDSRIGSFAALALMLTLAARGGALTTIAAPGPVALALVGAATLARGAMLLPMALLRPARPDGLGASLRNRSPTRLAVGLVLAAAIGLALLPWPATPAAALVALAITTAAHRQIGGYTGDVFGAVAVLAECAALAAAT